MSKAIYCQTPDSQFLPDLQMIEEIWIVLMLVVCVLAQGWSICGGCMGPGVAYRALAGLDVGRLDLASLF